METSTRQRVFIGIGSNLGEREEFLQHAFQSIQQNPDFYNVAVSPVYETKPWGGFGGDYLNAVAGFDTDLDAVTLYQWAADVEQSAGRVRTVHNAPRTLDLDLLFYGPEKIITAGLKVPHPRLHERAFVLIPLCDLAPDFIHPVYQKTVYEMLKSLSAQELSEVKKYENNSKCGFISKNA